MKPVRDFVEVRPAGSTVTSDSSFIDILTAPPEVPGISRPVWLTILGSVPTGLVWYGYYKFCVEEELYQYEVRTLSLLDLGYHSALTLLKDTTLFTLLLTSVTTDW